MERLNEFLTQAFEKWPSIFVCGPSVPAFYSALGWLLGYQHPAEQTLALLERAEFTGRPASLRVHVDPDLDGLMFLRAALRQDPDCVILDSRALSGGMMLVDAKLTGHRLIAHFPESPQEAFERQSQTLMENFKMNRDGLGQFVQLDLYIGLDEFGPMSIWQVNLEGHLVELFRREGEVWRVIAEPAGAQPVRLEAAPVEPMELPDDLPCPDEPLLTLLRRHLSPLGRSTWLPVRGGTPAHFESSHFGGDALLAEGENWPCCGDCGAPLFHILQIQLSQAPSAFQEKLGRKGYFQLFYCISESCAPEAAWAPFSANSLSRKIESGTVHAAPASRYQPVAIQGWVERREYPNWEECPRYWKESRDYLSGWSSSLPAIAAGDADSKILYSKYLEHFRLSEDALEEAASFVHLEQGDKLLGWPAWSQGVEYPNCPTCQRPMEMLLQINNDGGEGSTFGQIFAADGNGHVYVCPEHGHSTFSWACG